MRNVHRSTAVVRIATMQDLHREFDASIPYMVSRVMTGYVEEVLSATDTLIITGDIVMDEMDVRAENQAIEE